MFSTITAIQDEQLNGYIDQITDPDTDSLTTAFELSFLKELIKYSTRLMESIDYNELTGVIKKQILKITALLVHATDSKLNGAIGRLYNLLTSESLNDLEEMQILQQSQINEYTMSVGRPCLPTTILSQIGGIPASCGLHAVMHMLLSMEITSNFFNFTDILHQREFAAGFNRLNNGEMCTVMSEINDVLRSFADTIAAFIPPGKVYSAIGTKGLNEYNFCDFLKPSIKINFGLKKEVQPIRSALNRTTVLSLKESIIYDIDRLTPEWLLFDVGMWCCFTDGINIEINIGGTHRYRLHSFIANTGMHYICCILDKINTERGQIDIVRIYDDMATNTVRMAPINAFPLDSIGALVFHRII